MGWLGWSMKSPNPVALAIGHLTNRDLKDGARASQYRLDISDMTSLNQLIRSFILLEDHYSTLVVRAGVTHNRKLHVGNK